MTTDRIAAEKQEEPEGLGEDKAASWGNDYPIDTLLIRNESRTIHDVLRRINNGSFNMDPDFQRDFIWDENKQSKLIESVVMRIPLPVFYLAEDDNGVLVVVDGLQRFSTFKHFVDNKLALKLPSINELNKKKFKDLSPKLQNRIEDCNLILYVIDTKAPEKTRLDIFDRVNSGVPLSRQQMRNALYKGSGTKFLTKESKTNPFLEATRGSLNTRTMRDREFVNRYCAFQILDIEKYRDMDAFLAEALKYMNNSSSEFLAKLSSQFRTSLKNNVYLFGEDAFRKPRQTGGRSSVLNASLWDIMSTGLSVYPLDLVKKRSRALKTAFAKLMKDKDFINAITRGTSDLKKVRYRFSAARKMFQMVFNT